jgi:hypothetical protein
VCPDEAKPRSQGTFRARSQDVKYVLPVDLLDVANGALRTIGLPEGKTLQVTISEGAEHRQMLRLKQQGMAGFGDGPPGDAYVELQSSHIAYSTARTTIFMPRSASLHSKGGGAGCADRGADHRRSLGGDSPEKAFFELKSWRLRPPSIRSRFVNTTRWERSFRIRPFLFAYQVFQHRIASGFGLFERPKW